MEIVYDIQAIMNFLPHRYPFILVDRVVKLVPGEEVVALKNVTINEPFFQGHFRDRPVMPGVLLVEAMAQAGGLLVLHTLGKEYAKRDFYFMGMDKVRFRKPVYPGDQLQIEVDLLRYRPSSCKMQGRAFVAGELVCEAEFMAAIIDK